MINDEALTGRTVSVNGPFGDFWLRPSSRPLLMIAGGSGLAPIMAILKDAVREILQRPLTLIFGARAQQDLYALADIQALARKWSAPFTFIPVLSEEDEKSEWKGTRGWVTAPLATLSITDVDAYLCGPPAMVDAAQTFLLQKGVHEAHIYADRFVTQGDVHAVIPRLSDC